MLIPTKTTVVALLGLPRSGTTLVARHIGAHSLIATLMEPYQAQRESGYKETELQQLCADFDITVPSGGGILLKETATRPINFALTLQTLGVAAAAGYPTGIILQIRSPIEAFYSQVEASQAYWKRGEPLLDTEAGLRGYWENMESAYSLVQEEIYRFPLRVCFFHRFLANPRYELSRLMAFFPLVLEPTQFDSEVARQKMRGRTNRTTERLSLSSGDARAWDKNRRVSLESVTDRTGQLDEFRTRWGNHLAGRQMLQLHDCITELQTGPLFDDDEIAARFLLQFRKLFLFATQSSGETRATQIS